MIALVLSLFSALEASPETRAAEIPNRTEKAEMQQHPYIGMWVTANGRIRQELLANGRYDEARGTRQSAYQGHYEITGNRIHYWDDIGFEAGGAFVSDDELHHAGMTFFRQR